MQGESGKSQMAPQMALGHRVPRGNGPGVPGSPRTNPFKFTRGDTDRHSECRPMPKSAEAKARAAAALKEKRHRLKVELKAKAQLDAKGEVACEDCKKHIVAVISANLHIDRLKHALEM